MSIHPSLAASDKSTKSRSVLKRSERLKTMMEKEKWKEGDSVFGLPKIKTLRIKIKKEKAAKEATTADAAAAAAPAASETKEAPAKGAAPKATEKK